MPNVEVWRYLVTRWSALQNKNDYKSLSLALDICKSLQSEKLYVELETFLNELPKDDIYLKNEHIVRAKISVAFGKNYFTTVYDLIENNTFQNGEDLIDVWDRTHYAEEIERTKKPLTALSRFRIRERFLPPKSICPTRERRKFNLDETSRRVLQQWLAENVAHPYPSKETKAYLSEKAHITRDQVKTWFANARRRAAHAKGADGSFSSRRYHAKKSRNKKSEQSRPSFGRAPEHDTRPDGEYKIIEEPLVQGSVLSQHRKDDDSPTEMTATSSMSDNFEAFSRRPPDDGTVTSNGSIPEHVTGLVLDNSLGNSTWKQAGKDLPGIPPMELVEPHMNVNPNLFGPTPMPYFYDYYSCHPFHHPCSSITMKENGEHLERYPLPASYYIHPPRCACFSPCVFLEPAMMRFPVAYQEHCTQKEPSLDDDLCPSSEIVRFDAAEALLDLSLKSSSPLLPASCDCD